ncbi:anti-repressor [Paenibacillus phage Sitara]|uniref:DNA binding anti-repressor n=1 Tax=Paenibacillus phage Sitara TaxID=1589755 RepID=A0A0C5AFE4_9CAUD|nr:anti-repressor [Paenibacillus phage Sitara]AJK28024.1 DNA binding anti-repressor [Paenibacillus phage Sitara]
MNVASILITIGRNITYLRTSCGYFEKDLLSVRTSRGNPAFDQSNYNKQEVSQIKKQVDLSNFFEMGKGNLDDEMMQESYRRLEKRTKCRLSKRLETKRNLFLEEGVSREEVNKLSKMDVIFDDAILTEIYLTVVEEMNMKSKVEPVI